MSEDEANLRDRGVSLVAIEVGDSLKCALIEDGKPTGKEVWVRVLEVKRDPETEEPVSVLVATAVGRFRTCWVKPEFLYARSVKGTRGQAR